MIMMKKKVLAASIAAVLGGVVATNASAALSIQEAGIGHALIVPYFTTQNGNATLLNIVNTDPVNGKAVKVRFRSAVDSDDIFDFQVFLSPNDVWTANVSKDAASGLSKLTTTDKSCTLPSNVNQSFVTSRLVSYTDPNGNVRSVADQTREGYVEIFNMGDIPPTLPTGAGTALGASVNALYTAIKHVSGVAPCTSTTLLGIEANAKTVGAFATAPAVSGATTVVGNNSYAANQQLIIPTTGLMGNWTIINLDSTRTFTGSMPAIQASAQTMIVYSGQAGVGRTATHAAASNATAAASAGLNMFPQLALTEDGVLLNQAQTGVITADYDFPDMSTPYEAVGAAALTPYAQASALSTSILRASVVNEFLTDTTISAGTDWVVSMPTRRYHVAGRGTNYGAAADSKGYPSSETIDAISGGVTAPFVAANVTFATNGRSACVTTGAAPTYYDREETASAGGGAVISPGVPFTYSLCGEVNVLSWNNSASSSAALGAELTLANSSAGSVRDGWAYATMGGAGLPVLGDAFIKAYNPSVAAGVSGNFGGSFKHRFR